MTVSTLRQKLQELRADFSKADADLVVMFLSTLEVWSHDESPPSELMERFDRLLGNVWFSADDHHRKVYDLLNSFRDDVKLLPGMTMNERLFVFDLMKDWDSASRDARAAIRCKLEAPE